MRALLFMISLATFAAANAKDQPARFPVGAGLVPIDDGSFHVVVLMPDTVGSPPIPVYCGANWSLGLIQTQFKSPAQNNAIVTNPTGCWLSSALTQNRAKSHSGTSAYLQARFANSG